jgi:hypothetical protein
MDVAGTVITTAVMAAVGLVLAWLGKGRFESIDRRIDRLEQRLEHRIDSVQLRVDSLQTSVDAMRSDLTQVALAVGVRRRATNA